MNENVQIRQCREEDVEQLARLITRNGESDGRHELLEEVRRKRDCPSDPDRCFVRVVAEVRGDVVGTGLVRSSLFLPTTWRVVDVQVDERGRRRGVGSAIFLSLEDAAVQDGALGLEARVLTDDERARTWALQRGFSHSFDELSCVLQVGSPKLAPGRPTAAAVDGISFVRATDVERSQLYDATARLLAQIPEIGGGAGPSPKAVQRFFTQRISPALGTSWVALRYHRVVGVSLTAQHGQDQLYTWFTGVDPALWGRGVASTLKELSVESAGSLGIRRMLTVVSSTNGPMLAVNKCLGYTVVAAVPVFRKHLGRCESK